MAKCPECGRNFIKKRHNQKYCRNEVNSSGVSRCKRRASYRRCHKIESPAIRERAKIRARKWRQKMIDEGSCSRCGNEPAEPGLKLCAMCAGRGK